MKKLFTLLFSVGLVTAVFAQSGDRQRNDSRNNDYRDPSSPYSNNNQSGSPRNDSRNNDYRDPSSPYSNNNNQSGYPGQYSNEDPYNRNSQWNERGYDNQYARSRERMARQQYEMMMMRRNEERYNHQRRYDNYSPYAPARKAVLQIRIGAGNRNCY